MNNIYYVIIICIMVSCSPSTEYKGYVYDENKKPLKEVKIQIVGTDIYSFSDEKGFFSINHKGLGKEILALKSGYDLTFYKPDNSEKIIRLFLKLNEK